MLHTELAPAQGFVLKNPPLLFAYGDLIFDWSGIVKQIYKCRGNALVLTETQARMFRCIAYFGYEHPGEYLYESALQDAVFGSFSRGSNVIASHVGKVRKALVAAHSIVNIESVRGRAWMTYIKRTEWVPYSKRE
jgi:DNA-binding response OmpR family regulator